MFGLSVATELIQGSTERTWNCVLHFVHSIWSKFNYNSQTIMPKSRKRHHSRSRSRSRSHSRDRSRDRDDKYKRNDSHEKERDGKRRRIDSFDSPTIKRSVSEEPEVHQTKQDMKKEDSEKSINTSLQNVAEDQPQTEGATECSDELSDSDKDIHVEEHENQEHAETPNDIEVQRTRDSERNDDGIVEDVEDTDLPNNDENATFIRNTTVSKDEQLKTSSDENGSTDINTDVAIANKCENIIKQKEKSEESRCNLDEDQDGVEVNQEVIELSIATDVPNCHEDATVSQNAPASNDGKIENSSDANGTKDIKNDVPISNKCDNIIKNKQNTESTENLDEAMDVMEVDQEVTEHADTLHENTSPNKSNSEQNNLDESVEIIEIDDETDGTLKAKKTSEEMCLPSTPGSTIDKKKLQITPKKYLSPKQIQKKMESEKKRLERQKEKDDKERKRIEERDRIMKEKQKKKEEKQRELEQKQKEKELKEEQKQKEKELKEEQKRKEREEKESKRKEEEQKRKEKEMEKQREEEKKQKAAAAFANFFVPKKSDNQCPSEDKKFELHSSIFMAFEVKSDMKLPPSRRLPLSEKQREILDNYLKVQSASVTYLKDLKSGKNIGRCPKTWPYEDVADDDDDDVEIVEEETKNVGETISEDIQPTKVRAKFLKFHENRRPAYFGTWRKKSRFIRPRRPLAEDTDTFNYEEDSGDDWEEEEQGESLTGSDDEADKENEDEKDDYEVDNEFFVPHGHLSDDEVDDEENTRMSPESMKQKLKLLKDEFDLDMKSKTHKLKPKAIGCIWYKKDGGNVDEAIHKYLQPLAIICRGNIEIKSRSHIFSLQIKQKSTLNPEVIPLFIKFIHGSVERKKHVFQKFKSYMLENGNVLEFSKRSLLTYLSENASLKKIESGPNKNKVNWIVNADILKKYSLDIDMSNAGSDK